MLHVGTIREICKQLNENGYHISEYTLRLWVKNAVIPAVFTGTEDEALRKSCAKRVPVPGKKNQYQKETDYDLYLGKLAVACTVFPNLNDKELQDSYKVMGADALLKTMLTPGEYAEYLTKIQEVCGFDTTMQDEVDEAKN